MIEQFTTKIKPYLNLIILALIFLIIMGIFYLNKNKSNNFPLKIVHNQDSSNSSNTKVIGSKNGSKYYFPWCGALERIKPENRIEFASPTLARSSGYTPAKNCKGVE